LQRESTPLKTVEFEKGIYKLFAGFQYLKAAELLEEAVKANKEAKLFHNLAAAYYKLGNFPKAERMLDEAVGLDDGCAKSYYLLGLVHKDEGHLEEAIRFFDKALSLDEGLSQAYLQRGICCFLGGSYDRAREDLERAMAIDPDSLWPNYNLAILKLTTEDWEGAKKALIRCIKINPVHIDEYADLLSEIGKVEVFGELYSQSHRMKNMLSILGNSLRELLRSSLQRISEPDRKSLQEIIENQDKLYADFVSYLSTLKRDPIELDLFDVNEVIDGAVFALGKLPEKIVLRKKISAELPEIICDASLIREALLNVLLNAVEAVGEEGVIEVEARQKGADAICIRIKDTGCGISKEDASRIFEFGYSTKSFGSGIGLSQAQRTVRMHGGEICFESKEGAGSIFEITLPMNASVKETLSSISLKPAIFEDMKDLLISSEKADEQLM